MFRRVVEENTDTSNYKDIDRSLQFGKDENVIDLMKN